jgi:hypothetical protein
MPIMSKRNYILYGTLGCHLCDDAERLLLQAQAVLPIAWCTIDIALDQNLMTKYGTSIPVLTSEDGQSLAWPFSLLDVYRLQTKE